MNKKLYGFTLSLILCLAFVPAAMASDGPCVQDTMSDYITDFGPTVPPSPAGCTIGSLTFNNFDYFSADVSASGVEVTPGQPPTVGFGDGPGFQFNGAWSATTPGSTADADVTFDITAAPGTAIADVDIILGAGSVTGTGSATYDEEVCNAQSVCVDFQATPGATSQNILVNLSNTALGGPQTFLSLEKDLSLSAGSAGTAAFSSFGNQYSLVPEPRGISLVAGLGLLLGFAIFKRRQVAQS
jgi:hypothetical protein